MVSISAVFNNVNWLESFLRISCGILIIILLIICVIWKTLDVIILTVVDSLLELTCNLTYYSELYKMKLNKY